MIRGIRGATTVSENTVEAVEESTIELILEMVSQNELIPENISFIMITVTSDITATFPARVIREMKNWQFVPVMCAVEMEVKGALASCIRLLITADLETAQHEVQHVYLREAEKLRPDLKKNVLD